MIPENAHPDADLSLAAFAAIAMQAGLSIAAEDLPLMREGYRGLQVMLARLPATPDLFAEPAVVFVAPSGEPS
ncbi:MAG: hypothetical protein J0H01_21130 [Rhizobiales bacterium]|nr:hypothetical protein [Hyphomicrobiales bacterium]